MQFNNLSISFGLQKIFENVNINLPYNEKIGLVGVNGAGKTTLFKIILGLLEPDSGEVIIRKGYRVGWLPQVISDDIETMDINVFDYLLSGRPIAKLNKNLENLYLKLSEENCNQEKVFNEIDKVQRKLEYWDSYNADSTLLKIIAGVKLDDSILCKKVSELSGGQKSKIAFIRLLYSNPEIILLDEPTNHLDEESRDYIINYLKYYKGTVLVISHDIDFLDQVTSKTLFIDKRTKKMELFDGNYSKFQKILEQREVDLLKQSEIQKREEEKLRAIINKYATASGKRKRMAQDREKKLEKLLENRVEVIAPNKKANFSVTVNRDSSNIPLKIENLTFKYDKSSDINIINHLNFELYRGEKFLVVGENGVGKSTLLKLIMGLLTPDAGSIYMPNKTDIQYYAQELEILDGSKTIIENFDNSLYNTKRLRGVLAKFLFYGDDVFKKVDVLSPGEKSRVALAKISLSGANLILLDEPTNHLDPETQKLIADVFKDYDGTLVVVSHNPDFVDNIGIERLLILPDGRIEYYDREVVEHYGELNSTKRRKL